MNSGPGRDWSATPVADNGKSPRVCLQCALQLKINNILLLPGSVLYIYISIIMYSIYQHRHFMIPHRLLLLGKGTAVAGDCGSADHKLLSIKQSGSHSRSLWSQLAHKYRSGS